MVSEFLTEVDGRLKLKLTDIEQYPTVPAEAREYLEPGKDREGYWTAENVLNQIKTKAIPIFEALYPNCISVFAFDNSSNHAIFAKDALVSKKMNLNPGGMQPKMHIHIGVLITSCKQWYFLMTIQMKSFKVSLKD